nr:S1 RNA-binding domain-containing protein [Desulfobacterales bacterium]
MILSREEAAEAKIWDELKEIYEKNGTIRGKITSRVKGGLSVDVDVLPFLPSSHPDLRPVRNLDTFVGMEHDFKILRCEKSHRNIVLSRRPGLGVERISLRKKRLDLSDQGGILEGIVSNITSFHLFIDLGRVDGLVRITTCPGAVFGILQTCFRLVTGYRSGSSFDIERERVSLGIEHVMGDLWKRAQEKCPLGAKIKGGVVGVKENRAFVGVEEGGGSPDLGF